MLYPKLWQQLHGLVHSVFPFLPFLRLLGLTMKYLKLISPDPHVVGLFGRFDAVLSGQKCRLVLSRIYYNDLET
jgi:hypothetical protein